MTKIDSNADDCFKLASKLEKMLGNKIHFHGNIHQELISGEYFWQGMEYGGFSYVFEEGLPFNYSFCKNVFLRIQVGSFYPHINLFGEKLAALSIFYEILSEDYGEPTVFYTTKSGYESVLSLHWSFVDKEEDIIEFKKGYINGEKIEELIVMGESKSQMNGYQLNNTTRKSIAKQIGLPFELSSLVAENIEEFSKCKTGKEIGIPEGLPVTSFQKKMSLEKIKK